MPNSDLHPSLPRVLLIDDDAISREVLGMMLEMHGFLVESAEDGSQALQLLEKAATPPEVILMDTQMPGLSGVELVQALRRCCDVRGMTRGNTRGNTPIVAISGSEVSEEIRQTTDGFLLKPIQVESLVALLENPNATEEAQGVLTEVSASSEPIDSVVLGKLKAMMPAAAVLEIYTAVASDLETRLVVLGAAMDSGDEAEVRRVAHAIKGGCAMVGLSSATQAASRLESSNLAGAWPQELLQLHFALSKLQGILVDGLL